MNATHESILCETKPATNPAKRPSNQPTNQLTNQPTNQSNKQSYQVESFLGKDRHSTNDGIPTFEGTDGSLPFQIRSKLNHILKHFILYVYFLNTNFTIILLLVFRYRR